MKRLKFKCTLLSDIIINQKAATEGNNQTLDFIPGNTFLGIVAAHYMEFGDKAHEVFHSGRVRFGDAHPVSLGDDEVRTLHVPASMYYPKLKSAETGCYIHHFYDRGADHENAGRPQQLKQCRQGFYAFSGDNAYPAVLEKSFAIKSAYDRERRRALDSQMFGYESLDAGACFYFDVEFDDDSLADNIQRCLTGVRRVGRSRSAQYGLVEIQCADYQETASTQGTFRLADGGEYATVYADGRLIFLDENDEPTFQPTAADLGLPGGQIVWKYSQVRTFGYAPWNNKRSARDTERCGIEKGSVFVVRLGDDAPAFASKYVGEYRNEGFGKVVYNPPFLGTAGDNGKARCRLCGVADNGAEQGADIKPLKGTPLLGYIAKRRTEDEAERYIFEKVNRFVSDNKPRFAGGISASQWGAIRSIAMQYTTNAAIVYELFDKTKIVTRTKDNHKESKPDAYLTHGVAETVWKKKRRKDTLRQFVDEVHSSENVAKYGDITAQALVNLASEMAKHSK